MDITRDNIEEVLDSGNLYAAMQNGRWWRLRRNGKTQTWKTDPSRFRIPVKAGLKSYSAITETDLVSVAGRSVINPQNFAHHDDVPANVRSR